MLFFFIDDDTDDQEIFGMAMSEVEPQASCIFANDGVEALKKLNDTNFVPSGIFIDLNMPKMNGSECLSAMRKIKRLDPIPIIIYSTSSDPEVMEQCMQLGATDFIVKPPGLKALTDRLMKVIRDNKLYGGRS